MWCEQVQEHLSAYLDRELTADLSAAVRAHLDTCGECRALADDLRATIDLVGRLPRRPAPEHLADDVQREIERRTILPAEAIAHAEPQERSLPLSRARPWPRVAAVAATLLLAAGIGFLAWLSEQGRFPAERATEVAMTPAPAAPESPPASTGFVAQAPRPAETDDLRLLRTGEGPKKLAEGEPAPGRALREYGALEKSPEAGRSGDKYAPRTGLELAEAAKLPHDLARQGVPSEAKPDEGVLKKDAPADELHGDRADMAATRGRGAGGAADRGERAGGYAAPAGSVPATPPPGPSASTVAAPEPAAPPVAVAVKAPTTPAVNINGAPPEAVAAAAKPAKAPAPTAAPAPAEPTSTAFGTVAALPAKPSATVAGPTPAAAGTPSLMVVTTNGADVVQQTLNYVADGKANVEQLGRVVTLDRLNRIDNQLVIQADSVDEAGRGLVELFHVAGWQPLAAAGQRDHIDADDEAYRRAGAVRERSESADKVAAAKEAPSAERKSAVPPAGVYYLAHRNGEETWVVLTDRDSLSRFGSQLAAQDRLAVSETSSPQFRAIPRLQSQMRDALAKAALQEKLQTKGLPAFGRAPDADADTGGGAKVAARSTKAAETGKAVEKDLKDTLAQKEDEGRLGDAEKAAAAGTQWKGKTSADVSAKGEAAGLKAGEPQRLGQTLEAPGQLSGGLAVTAGQPAPAQEPSRPITAPAAPAAAPAPPAVQPSAEEAAPTAKAASAGRVTGGSARMAVQTGAADRAKQQYTGEALDERESVAQQSLAQAPPARRAPQQPGQETVQTEGGQTTTAFFFADDVQRFHLALPRPEDQVILVIRLQAARAAAEAKDAAQK